MPPALDTGPCNRQRPRRDGGLAAHHGGMHRRGEEIAEVEGRAALGPKAGIRVTFIAEQTFICF